MPKNINVTMADSGYQNAYEKTISKSPSRKKHPVNGNVAPIKSSALGRNIYQNGNMFNIARNVADNERHDDVGEIIEAKNWQDRVRRVSKNGYYDPTAHAMNSHYWNGLLYPTDKRNADTGYYGPEVHATTGKKKK